jgi:hypothetical protein
VKGDERPCQRCIKRGLADACHDGVRKKAKYLHDAPTEALMPGVGGQNLFNHAAAMRNNMALRNAETDQQEAGHFYQNPQSFNAYPQNTQMPPPMMQDNTMNAQNFGQQSPVSPSFNLPGQQPIHNPSMSQPQAEPTSAMPQNWNGAMFDPNDTAFLGNLDLASMNFGNHYGALEFGMLGHMATGAGETPPSDSGTQRGSVPNGSNQYNLPLGSFSESPTQQFAYNDAIMSDWPGGQNLYGQQFAQPTEPPHAFAIESGAANFTSPDSASSPQQGMAKFEDSPTMTYKINLPPTPTSGVPNTSTPQSLSRPHSHPRQPSHISTPQLKSRSQLPTRSTKRPRDPSSIYTTVTAPYSYTTGFHSLIAYLQRRFAAHPSKTLTIAKSLASIRPSFIATTKTLNRDDLIFMEKCFQRTLWEYEGFIEGVGTPTIVARRTGEVAAVGKEFSILTGWKKDVLLGREPNLNVNRGGTASGSATGSGVNTATAGRGTGMNTPSGRGIVPPLPPPEDANADGKRLQPVFLAELLDDESVVEFYEGFARLAFGDSRGSVMGRGKLLKYRTKEDIVAQNLKEEGGGDTKMEDAQQQQATAGPEGVKRMSSGAVRQQRELKKGGIANEREMGQRLGERDGKVECTICWTVKRDVFDIPMLIVMNVSTSCVPVSL